MSQPAPGTAERLTTAVLVVKSPSGAQNRVRIQRVPFRIGRHGDNDLVLRDSRASRHHAEIVNEDGGYAIQDLGSSYGLFINGQRVPRHRLRDGDRIEFGFPDSYRITFQTLDTAGSPRTEVPAAATTSTGLRKLRATLEVARALQTALSTDDVLATVVDAALTVTGCERGFLLLRKGDDLETRIARAGGAPLPASDLRVPTKLLSRALNQRKEFLSMDFDPDESVSQVERSIYDLELRSVVCLPLVRVRTGSLSETARMSAANDTAGLLYMDSRSRSADLSAGGRELLTTLALEASTVLENARLLEEQWGRERLEQELRIARQIQESLMPRGLPETGWFRAAAATVPSLQVGGDYVDVRNINEGCWAAVVADVSGKGVGAAILASLLQGMFVASPYARLTMSEMIAGANRYLNDRTGGEQYATLFYCTLDYAGCLRWINAGHPPPILLRAGPVLEALEASGPPAGMLEEAVYPVTETQLRPGDRVVIFSDGIIEAESPQREVFGLKRLRSIAAANAELGAPGLYASIRREFETFTAGTDQKDDMTLCVLEFRP